MFYHHECLKKGGRFYLCWMANSWPLRFSKINSGRIRQVNIEDLCQDLREVMNSESFNPSQRFSLRLSSQLIMGLVKIYALQIQMFACDVFHFDAAVKRGILKRQKLPIKTAKKPKTTAPVEQEVVINAVLPEKELVSMINNSVLNVSSITLLDQVLPPNIIINDGFGEEVDPMLLLNATVEEVRAERIARSTTKTTTFNVKTPENLIEDPVSEIMKRRPFMLDITTEKTINAITDVSMVNVPEIQIIPHLQTSVEITPVKPRRRIPKPIVEELILEPLEENAYPILKRKQRCLILDSETVLDSNLMKRRIATCDTELRCLFASQDTIGLPKHTLRMNIQWLMANPAADVMDNRMLRMSANGHHQLFKRNLITRPEPDMREMASPVEREAVRAKRLSAKTPELTVNQTENLTLPPILEKSCEAAMESVMSPMGVTRVQDKTLVPDISLGVISELDSITRMTDNINTANVPDVEISEATMANNKIDTSSVTKSPTAARQAKSSGDTAAIVQTTADIHDNGKTLEISANGSPDKTPVCLGDESLTELNQTKTYLNAMWEPPEILKMINRARMDHVRPLTFEKIIEREYSPQMGVSKKRVACRAFYSILKLLKHGFIKVAKVPGTHEISHISFGERLRELRQ